MTFEIYRPGDLSFSHREIGEDRTKCFVDIGETEGGEMIMFFDRFWGIRGIGFCLRNYVIESDTRFGGLSDAKLGGSLLWVMRSG